VVEARVRPVADQAVEEGGVAVVVAAALGVRGAQALHRLGLVDALVVGVLAGREELDGDGAGEVAARGGAVGGVLVRAAVVKCVRVVVWVVVCAVQPDAGEESESADAEEDGRDAEG